MPETAKIETYDGSVFHLPANAQIEIRDLKKMTRNDVIMELTALELQKLPPKKQSDEKNTAFILHGSLQDSMTTKEKQHYIFIETNGALSLFEQGYVAGFIIKWNRLLNTFPKVSSKTAIRALIKAYEIMAMPARLDNIMRKHEMDYKK